VSSLQFGAQIDASESSVLRIVSENVKGALGDVAERHGEELLRRLLPIALAGALAGL
jgi:hypothetical protein